MERKEAQRLGLTKFTTNRPCVNGHLTYRYTSTGSCSQCINGIRGADKPKTFNDRAKELRITALSVYNEGIKMLTANYEQALKVALEYEQKALELAQALTIKTVDDATKLIDYKLQQEHKQAVKRMIKVNVFIHPDDVFEAKAYLLERAQSVCPQITADDVSYKRKVQGGVLHEVRCFPEHKDEIITATNQAYNAHNVAITPQS